MFAFINIVLSFSFYFVYIKSPPWGQIWGYAQSRPTSVFDEVRDAIKLQFRNQSHYNII